MRRPPSIILSNGTTNNAFEQEGTKHIKNYLDGGDAVVEAIRKLGIDHIISSPGSEWAPVWEAMARQDHDKADGPNFIDTWHQTLAVDMAIGYSLITGRVQAVLLHAGAGLMQGSMGIMGTRHWEVPMLVLSGETISYGEDPDLEPGQQWARNLSIVGGPHRLIEPVVKYACQATSPKTLSEMVIRAGEMAARPPKGPTYLNVPLEHLLHEWSPPEIGRNVPPAPKTVSPDADIEAVADALAAAKNPVIVSEYGGRDGATFDALVGLAEVLAIPVFDGEASVCANFPKNHPLYQGTDMSAVKDAADLVLMVRCRAPWYPASSRPKNAYLVAIYENPHQAHMVYQVLQADCYLEGGVASSLTRLAEAVTSNGGGTGVTDRLVAATASHEALAAKNHAERQKMSDQTPHRSLVAVRGPWRYHARRRHLYRRSDLAFGHGALPRTLEPVTKLLWRARRVGPGAGAVAWQQAGQPRPSGGGPHGRRRLPLQSGRAKLGRGQRCRPADPDNCLQQQTLRSHARRLLPPLRRWRRGDR